MPHDRVQVWNGAEHNTNEVSEIPQVKLPWNTASSGIKIKLEGYSIVNMGVFGFLVCGDVYVN